MHQQHAIDRGIRQRQLELVDQRRQRRPRGRPFHHALRRRHEGEAALGLLAEQAEIGRGIADAEHALAARVDPAARGCRGRRNAAPPRRAAGRRNCADRRRRWTWLESYHEPAALRSRSRRPAITMLRVRPANLNEDDPMPAETKLFHVPEGQLRRAASTIPRAARPRRSTRRRRRRSRPRSRPPAGSSPTSWSRITTPTTPTASPSSRRSTTAAWWRRKAEAGKNPAGRRDRARGRHGQRRQARGQRDRDARPHRRPHHLLVPRRQARRSPATRCSRSAAAA